MINQAFEYLRQFKKVTNETEQLVIKVLKKRYPEISMNELVAIFESGISGDFGKIYNLDPETIIDWVRSYNNKKGQKRSYYETPLLTYDISIYDQRYPEKQEDWNKEVNKSYTAYLNGVSTRQMHPHIYDRLMVDGKIQMNAYLKYYQDKVDEAKQMILNDYFQEQKKKGFSYIYFIKNEK
jgi:hypothetical protein